MSITRSILLTGTLSVLAIAARAQDVPIQSGAPVLGQVAAAAEGEGVLSAVQYFFAVPEDATRVFVSLFALDPGHDLDLEVRKGERVALQGSTILSDYFSETVRSGSETLSIAPDSQPPLSPGVHYIGVVNYEAVEAAFTLFVEIEGGGTTEPTPTPSPTSTSTPTPTPSPTETPSLSPTPDEQPTPTLSLLERADLDGSGRVDSEDLLLLLTVWGRSSE